MPKAPFSAAPPADSKLQSNIDKANDLLADYQKDEKSGFNIGDSSAKKEFSIESPAKNFNAGKFDSKPQTFNSMP